MGKFAAFLFIIACGWITFQSGRYYEFYSLRPVAINNTCAHYDMKTGDFRWGAPPQVLNTMEMEMEEVLPPIKQYQPTVQGGKNGKGR